MKAKHNYIGKPSRVKFLYIYIKLKKSLYLSEQFVLKKLIQC